MVKAFALASYNKKFRIGGNIMEQKNVKKVVIDGLMIAIVFLATYFTKFPGPVPPGYINLGDAVIIIAALFFGKRTGFLAGAIGSAICDFAAGALIFVPVTFIVKGLEGYIMGALSEKLEGKKWGKLLTIIVGVSVMVVGYFIAEATILGLFDETLGLTAAMLELPLNLVQAGASAIVGYALSVAIPKKLVSVN